MYLTPRSSKTDGQPLNGRILMLATVKCNPVTFNIAHGIKCKEQPLHGRFLEPPPVKCNPVAFGNIAQAIQCKERPVHDQLAVLPPAKFNPATFNIAQGIQCNFATSRTSRIPIAVKRSERSPFVFRGLDKQTYRRDPKVDVMKKRMEERKQLFKVRGKGRLVRQGHKESLDGVRLNRRFNLLMEFRDNQWSKL